MSVNLRFPEISRQQKFTITVNASGSQAQHTYEMRKTGRANSAIKLVKSGPATADGDGIPGRRVWLEERLKELKVITHGRKSKRGLANFLHKPPARITEMMAGSYKIDAKIVKRLAEYLELPSEVVLAHIGGNVAATSLQSVRVVGAVQAGVWREALEWDESKWYPAPVAPITKDKFAHLPQFGLEVMGTSMNELWPDGSVIVCVNMLDLGREARHGEKVVVLRRGQDGMFEATVKELRQAEDGSYWLWPRSSDPAHQQPWKLPKPDEHDDNDDIRIVALVIRSVRNEA